MTKSTKSRFEVRWGRSSTLTKQDCNPGRTARDFRPGFEIDPFFPIAEHDSSPPVPRKRIREKEAEMSPERRCRACNAAIPPSTGRGRPRKFCTACVPPGAGAVGSAAWRAVNPERVAAYNDGRRKESKHVRS